MEIKSTEECLVISGLGMVAVRGDAVDIRDLPRFAAYKRTPRVVELNTGLLGEVYGLAYMLDHEDGTFTISEEFPISMVCDTHFEVMEQLNALGDDFVCWGVPSKVLKLAAKKDVLVECSKGYYR